MALIKLNRRSYYLPVRSVEVKKVSNGRFEVTYDDNRSFLVIGGVASGGAYNEWFCHHPEFYGDDAYLPTKSMIEAIRLGCQY